MAAAQAVGARLFGQQDKDSLTPSRKRSKKAENKGPPAETDTLVQPSSPALSFPLSPRVRNIAPGPFKLDVLLMTSVRPAHLPQKKGMCEGM